MHPLVVCAIFKQEAHYLKEWIEFHRIQGFSKFFLYNNNSNDNYLEVLQPYIDKGIVDLTEWPMQSPSQLQAYSDFIAKNNKKPVWAAMIDIDEFLFAPTGSLPELLNKFDHPSSLGINWRCFGSSKLTEYDPRPVIERFIFRHENYDADKHIKSLIRLDQEVKVSGDPHFFITQSGTFSENGILINGPFSGPSTEIFRINHYLTKSAEECLGKQNRGRADVANLRFNWGIFDDLKNATYEDRVIQKFLPELKQRLETK